MRPKKIRGELKTLIEQDIAAGKPRKTICQERGVTYEMIRKEFGSKWVRGPAVESVEEVPV